MSSLIELAERRLVPDALVRIGIRRLLARRLADLRAPDCERELANRLAFYDELRSSPVALVPDRANEQHYEVPPELFATVLGPRLKYSACWWPEGVDDLAAAEEASLELTASRAGIEDGQRVLELGCGWGALSLWIAERYPGCQVTAVSNSASQGELIRRRAREGGLDNLEVVTADMNDFQATGRFDRILSLEMFEHMRNWQELMGRVSSWLSPEGCLFLHVFCHHRFAYPYVDAGDADWMARHFFTGGMMPADDQPYHFQRDLEVSGHWRLDGRHYSRTLEAWLAKMDAARDTIRPLFVATYGSSDADRWIQRWRIFFMACSELFRFNRGQEWFVSHYRLEPRPRVAASLPSPTAAAVRPLPVS